MTEVKKTQLIGKGSALNSDFSIFEQMSGLSMILSHKNIRSGYFCVGQVGYEHRRIYPPDVAKYNLYIAGFKPGYENKENETPGSIVSKRRYSRLVVEIPSEKLEWFAQEKSISANQASAIKALSAELVLDEYRFSEVQVYKMLKDNFQFSLEMTNLEWLKKEKNEEIFSGIINEKGLEVVDGKPKIFMYEPNGSRGHFLAGYRYIVRAIAVRDGNSSHPEKMLCTDLLCGVTGMVHNKAGEFKEIDW